MIRRVTVRLADAASGETVEEITWLNDGTDATALAQEVAGYLVDRASSPELEATINVSDEG